MGMRSIIITRETPFKHGTAIKLTESNIIFMLRQDMVYFVPDEAADVLIQANEARNWRGSYYGVPFRSMEKAA